MKIKQRYFIQIVLSLTATLGCYFFTACSTVGVIPGPMNVARAGHTATLLPNGKVLIAGGADGHTAINDEIASAELFDPLRGTWMIVHAMNATSAAHTAVLLSNGKVLVVGGNLASAELYDPATDQWALTGSMSNSHSSSTATLLKDGRVLVVGGVVTGGELHPHASSELYDPATGKWTTTGSLNDARFSHVATLLPNGKVLVAGGESEMGQALSSAELYDPNTGKWTMTESMIDVREYSTATMLPNGKVLVAGGLNQGLWSGQGKAEALSAAELYDPATGKWTATGQLKNAHFSHTAILLPNGKILVWGGTSIAHINTLSNPDAELYDPATGTWTVTHGMNANRWGYSATLLSNGTVLVAGGVQYVPHEASRTESLASTTMYDQKGHKIGVVIQTNQVAKMITFTSTELYDPATEIWTSSE